MKPTKNWFQRLFFRDRRGASRCLLPPLVAHYWTGGSPSGQYIRDISSTGLFLETDQRWYPGTVVRITLQRVGPNGEKPERCVTVQAMAVRFEPGGVGFAFIIPAITKRRTQMENQDPGMDRVYLERFVDELKQGNVEARFDP